MNKVEIINNEVWDKLHLLQCDILQELTNIIHIIRLKETAKTRVVENKESIEETLVCFSENAKTLSEKSQLWQMALSSLYVDLDRRGQA